MSKENGFLTLKIVLALCIVFIGIMVAIARYSETELPRVSSPEELRQVLWREQMLSLPLDVDPVYVDAGDFIYMGTNDDAIALAEGLVPVEGVNGTLCWPVTLFEDYFTHETVFLNANGEEAGRLAPPAGYNPLWLLQTYYPLDVPEDVDQTDFDPSRVVMIATLLADTNKDTPDAQTSARGHSFRALTLSRRPDGASNSDARNVEAPHTKNGTPKPSSTTNSSAERTLLEGGEGTHYYADASRPDDSGDGLSWETAKRTIQAAVDLASTGDTVLVTNGLYNVGTRKTPGGNYYNRLVITNGVTVKSVGGAEVTIIEGSGTSAYNTVNAIRCVFMPNGVLDGFTLQGGASNASTNDEHDKGGGGVSMLGATAGTEIRNCILRNNKSFDGGGAYRGRVINCVLYGNAASYGSAVYWCDVKNSTLSGNVGTTFAGGGACGGALTNSISFGNLNSNGASNYYGCAIGYSCTTPLPSGIGNIALNPIFAGASTSNFTLSAGSPCINSGTNGVVTTDTDLPGNPRIKAGRVDLGAYEVQQTTAYADAQRPDDSGDGFSWATAKRTIQAAVDLTSDGDLVLVTNGVYNVGTQVTPGGTSLNRLVLTHAVTVRSVGGARVTVIEGQGGLEGESPDACRCVFMNNGVLDGFTLKEGLAGSIYNISGSAHIDNVGGGVSMFGASEGTEVRNCIVHSGCAQYGGGAFAGRLVNCVLHSNGAYFGGGCSSSKLWNCTVAHNWEFTAGSYAVYNCSVTNSIVYGGFSYNNNPGQTGSGNSQFGHSCASPLQPGQGNIDQEPQFVDDLNADYRLLAWSPCIDAGDDASLVSGSDLLGHVRPRGAAVDMGAYEMPEDGDTDGDGLSDEEEVTVYGTKAGNPDTDEDGLDDASEVFSRISQWGTTSATTAWVPPPEFFGKIVKTGALNASLATPYHNNVALRASGEAVCWGLNTYGQCNVPDGATNLVDISLGFGHVSAVTSDGHAICWGRNNYGQCNVPDTSTNLTRVSTGWYHTIGLAQDGTVVCWGQNLSGQCSSPTGLAGVVQVEAGAGHSVAVKQDGSAICWGGNSTGQCTVPAGITNVVKVAAGYAHTLALLGDGRVVCWGDNSYGQCNVPLSLSNVIAVAAGAVHSLATQEDGRIVCWGWNATGQSNGQNTYSTVLDLDGGPKYSIALVAGNTNPLDPDSDDDGLNDGAEVTVHKTDPNNPDTDGDALRDGDEIAQGTGVFDPDSDDDGLKDGWEVAHGFNPLLAGETLLDPDDDGLTNEVEQSLGTDPHDTDSDHDGLEDGTRLPQAQTRPRLTRMTTDWMTTWNTYTARILYIRTRIPMACATAGKSCTASCRSSSRRTDSMGRKTIPTTTT